MTAIVPTKEPAPETKRHPWVCNWRIGHNTCNNHNLASDSNCRACGKPYAPRPGYTHEPGDGITERVALIDAVREYQTLATRVRELFSELDAIETRLGVLFEDQSCIDSVRKVDLNTYGHDRRVDYARPDDVLKRAERDIWRAVIQRSGVSRIASNKRWEEIQKQVESGDVPPLTPENVTAWVQHTVGDADEILREKVREVFDFLRPRNDHFRTNSQFEIGKRVVLEYMIDKADPRWDWRPKLNWHRRQIVTSLETLFRSLDGKEQSLTRWHSELEDAIAKCNPENATGETAYFKFKAHRNGTLHLTFTRPELVAKLNAIAGGKTLRGERKSAR